MKLAGAAALITGGGKRVGRAIALELARGGCDVAIHYRHSRTDAESLAEEATRLGRKALAIRADLNEPWSWSAVVEQAVSALDRLDVLINNASLFLTPRPDTVEGFEPAQWEVMLRTNVIAPMGLCHHARRHLAAHGCGKIINLCDASTPRPWPEHLAYSASKAALEAVTKALARALAPDVQVNGVAPGIAVFPESYPESLRQSLVAKVPLGRAGTPAEVARLVRFLIEDGDYVTGQIISIDGGRSMV